MDTSGIMSAQLRQLQQTVSLNMLSMAKSIQTAEAAVMLQDFAQTQASIQATVQAPHPTLGAHLDIKG